MRSGVVVKTAGWPARKGKASAFPLYSFFADVSFSFLSKSGFLTLHSLADTLKLGLSHTKKIIQKSVCC
jgi:hypothetical protein